MLTKTARSRTKMVMLDGVKTIKTLMLTFTIITIAGLRTACMAITALVITILIWVGAIQVFIVLTGLLVSTMVMAMVVMVAILHTTGTIMGMGMDILTMETTTIIMEIIITVIVEMYHIVMEDVGVPIQTPVAVALL